MTMAEGHTAEIDARELLATEVQVKCRIRTEGDVTWVEYESLLDLLVAMAGNGDLVRAVAMAVLTDHYKAGAYWSPMGQKQTGRWSCSCGATGGPVDRNLTKGHRVHVADVLALGLVPE